MTPTPELKPCGHCKCKAAISEDRQDMVWGIYCDNCALRTDYFDTLQEAVYAWNRRDKEEDMEKCLFSMQNAAMGLAQKNETLQGLLDEIASIIRAQADAPHIASNDAEWLLSVDLCKRILEARSKK